MNELLAVFFTWQFLFLCGGISAFCFIIRTIIEYFILDNPKMPGNSNSKFWREGFLVLLPVFCGIMFPVIAKTFTYPDAITEIYAKILFSATAGLLSPTIYRVVKALLWKNVSENAPQVVEQYSVLNKLNDHVPSSQPTADDVNPTEPKI